MVAGKKINIQDSYGNEEEQLFPFFLFCFLNKSDSLRPYAIRNKICCSSCHLQFSRNDARKKTAGLLFGNQKNRIGPVFVVILLEPFQEGGDECRPEADQRNERERPPEGGRMRNVADDRRTQKEAQKANGGDGGQGHAGDHFP